MRVIVAGTFGPIHDGHRALFRTALERGTAGVLVGLTTDELATAHRERPVPAFEKRRERVRETFADLDEWGREVEIREVDSRVGFAGTEADVDALVTSPETCGALATINDRRAENDFDPIEGIVVPYVRAGDGERISSTRLVAGEIDEQGRLQ
jgi:pantetheine-phosphate adenylyltransferase